MSHCVSTNNAVIWNLVDALGSVPAGAAVFGLAVEAAGAGAAVAPAEAEVAAERAAPPPANMVSTDACIFLNTLRYRHYN